MVSVRDRLGFRPFWRRRPRAGQVPAAARAASDQPLGAQLVDVTARRDDGPIPNEASPPFGTSIASE